MINKETSPFTPGSPVPVELFVGRSEQLESVFPHVKQSLSGRQENLFLTGERGIGKSSFASFLRSYAINQNMLAVHLFLGGVSTLDQMVRHVFDGILKEARGYKWFDRISDLFGKYIREIGLFGISLSFSPPKEDLLELWHNFSGALNNLIEKIGDERDGLFIAMDDINGLVERVEFANWYKSFADHVSTHYERFPVFIMLTGLPEKRDKLYEMQPSLMRIFQVEEIERLANEEVRQFMEAAFEKAGMRIRAEALNHLTEYSSGLPVLMHEIGDAVFWTDTDGEIDERDALEGIMVAADRVGRKYLESRVYSVLRSKRYRSILRKLASLPGFPSSPDFTRKEAEARLDGHEKRVLHNFLRRLTNLGVIRRDLEAGEGSYSFANKIYPVYIWMESRRRR